MTDNEKEKSLLQACQIQLNQLPCAAYILRSDSDLHILYANSSFYKLISCNPKRLQYQYGNSLTAFLDQQSVFDVLTWKKQAVECEEHIGILKQKLRTNNQDELWLHTELKYIKAENFIVCTSFGITDWVQQNEIAKRIENLSDAFAGQGKLGVFTYNTATRIAKIHSMNYVLSQASPETQLLYGSFEDSLAELGLIHADYVESFKKALSSITPVTRKYSGDFKIKIREGEYGWATLILSLDTLGNSSHITGVFEDITGEREISLKYLHVMQFHQAILSEQDAYGQVDITEDKCLKLGGLWNLYNELADKITYSELITTFINKIVHPEDRAHYLEIMNRQNLLSAISNGISRLGCQFRRIVAQNKMVWMELRIHLLRDTSSGHILALMYIKNIDAEKKNQLSLGYLISPEESSGNFYKSGAQTAIQEYLRQMPPDSACALLLLEVRGISSVKSFSGILTKAFRKSDIAGRDNQGHFLLFLKKMHSREAVRERLHAFYQISEKSLAGHPAAIYTGISICHKNDRYQDKYQQALSALLESKKTGPGSFTFFTDATSIASLEPQDENLTGIEELVTNEEYTDSFSPNSFDLFISEQGDMAYLVNPMTYDLICGNRAFYDRIGMTPAQCEGLKCYEAVHRRETPCPFCGKANWSSDKFYLWRNYNTALEQEFLIKNKLVHWQNQEVLLALAIDISNDKSVLDLIDNSATESHILLNGVQKMGEAKDQPAVMEYALETIGTFFAADAVFFWKPVKDQTLLECSCTWNVPVSRHSLDEQQAVTQWILRQSWDSPINIQSPEEMLLSSLEMYNLMVKYGCCNERWLALQDDTEILGYFSIENISMNFQNIAFLESFTTFIINEIKKRRLMEDARYASTHDEMTTLLNRTGYFQFIRRLKSDSLSSVGIIMANINDLKSINNTLGTLAGDYFIKQFAGNLKKIFDSNTVFRLNGDEFLVIILNQPLAVLEDNIEKLKQLTDADDRCSVSIGYSWDNVENNLDVLIQQAAESMKVNKQSFYNQVQSSNESKRQQLLSSLIQSIEKEEFVVYLQPKVNLITHKVVGAEALIRYIHPTLGLTPPAKFIDTLERNGYIRYVDLFVLQKVCSLLEKWRDTPKSNLVLSLNFSRVTLLEENILDSVENILSQYAIERKRIEVEITESYADMGKGLLNHIAKELYQAGVSISLDDFGTKYTNLAILTEIDFDVLKLDKSLIHTLVNQKTNQIILKSILSMCRELNISVIAEGVEQKNQEDILRELGCTMVQGYLYGKPMPIEQFEQFYDTFHLGTTT